MTARVPRPQRLRTAATAEYWRAAAAGRLLVQACHDCAWVQLYPRTLCARCWSENVDWRASAGTGTVYAFTIIEIPGHPAWQGAPYAVAIVQLDEGPRLLSGILDQPPYLVHVGQRVRFVADANGDPAGPLPYFVSAQR
ncbi:MAG: hypothetical protein ABS81_01775 [Pseudonocardia sp. SCN 72-86]|nr:MAG: hypothetical protein ABS81_01775 [Pseudonocardia sp. SCN 72-86]